jgi:hypothetical protein
VPARSVPQAAGQLGAVAGQRPFVYNSAHMPSREPIREDIHRRFMSALERVKAREAAADLAMRRSLSRAPKRRASAKNAPSGWRRFSISGAVAARRRQSG